MLKINPIIASNVQLKAKNKNNKNYATPSFKSWNFDILDNFKKDLIYKSIQDSIDLKNRLGKYTIPPHTRTTYPHGLCFYNNRATSPTLMQLKISNGWWAQTPDKSATMIPWKMHLYADTEEDWQKLVATVGKYLNSQPVDWKTLSVNHPIDELNESEIQKGKAFTIYPANQQQFKQLAHDIDYIIWLNRMEIEGTNIIGDKQLGNTGRIFYRYEHKSGVTKDKVYNCNKAYDWNEYKSQYDPNRGADKYLAFDMTVEDDPFYKFNPREPLI